MYTTFPSRVACNPTDVVTLSGNGDFYYLKKYSIRNNSYKFYKNNFYLFDVDLPTTAIVKDLFVSDTVVIIALYKPTTFICIKTVTNMPGTFTPINFNIKENIYIHEWFPVIGSNARNPFLYMVNYYTYEIYTVPYTENIYNMHWKQLINVDRTSFKINKYEKFIPFTNFPNDECQFLIQSPNGVKIYSCDLNNVVRAKSEILNNHMFFTMGKNMQNYNSNKDYIDVINGLHKINYCMWDALIKANNEYFSLKFDFLDKIKYTNTHWLDVKFNNILVQPFTNFQLPESSGILELKALYNLKDLKLKSNIPVLFQLNNLKPSSEINVPLLKRNNTVKLKKLKNTGDFSVIDTSVENYNHIKISAELLF